MTTAEKLYTEWRAVQPLKPEVQQRIDRQFMIDFNYNTNHLEGNTLTYGQTKLLFLFGETTGNAKMRDYEEMKAHAVGLELMKQEAMDKGRGLTEAFIRELNRTILVQDYWKNSSDGSFRYLIKVGVYKTRPNSVITVSGEKFDYASPEETPALMADLVRWYNAEEKKGTLSPLELSALLHYRYIRIHPFEDGNGRIARLLVNYVLLRHEYPMIVIKTNDRSNYLQALHLCDIAVGTIPSDGAHTNITQISPLVDYISNSFVETTRNYLAYMRSTSGGTKEIWWYNNQEIRITNEKRQLLLEILYSHPNCTVRELSDKLGINKSAVQKHLDYLKRHDYIIRHGGTKGRWVVNLENSGL
jgi:Fic family protein